MEYVVLVDKEDNKIGLAEKMYAHEKELLHRAISVIIFDEEGRMLIQQRALCKYHCPEKWANACCTHPRDHETYHEAAVRRLYEELGINTEIEEVYDFIYRADVEPDLVEHELDHVFMGKYKGAIPFNEEEVMDVKWIHVDDLRQDISENQAEYTPWFQKIFHELDQRGLI